MSKLGLVLVTLASVPALAQPPPGAAVGPEPWLPSVPRTELERPAARRGPFLPVPPGATLVGELRPSRGGTVDRTFTTQWSYRDAIRFYDRSLGGIGAQVLSRRVWPENVTFTVRLSNGESAVAIVRNTHPVTIETREQR